MGKKEKSKKWDCWEHSVEPQSEENFNVKSSKKKVIAITSGVVFGIAVMVGTGVYLYNANQYKNRFFKGVSINSIDCSGMTVDQVENRIKEKVENYHLELHFREGITEDILGTDFAYSYVPNGQVLKLQQNQNPYEWVQGFYKEASFQVGKDIEFDEEQLEETLKGLDILKSQNQKDPQNAIIVYDNFEFSVAPEKAGTKLDFNKMVEEIKKRIKNGETSVDIDSLGVYLEPEILQDNVDLKENAQLLNQFAKASITYELPGKTQVLDGVTLINWMSVNEEQRYFKEPELFEAKVKEFVEGLAEQTDTAGKEHQFIGADNREIVVEGGNYGWKIDVKKEIEQLLEELNTNKVVKRTPIYKNQENTTENGGIGNTFVEIDLSKQHLWYHKDGTIAYETDIVSGTAAIASRKTPAGVYTLVGKQKNRNLRGPLKPDGGYEWDAFVQYWMPFNKGIGIHDASWRGKFGGTIYKYSGSHGCINIPRKNANQLYDAIEKGTVIVCYYGSESVKEQGQGNTEENNKEKTSQATNASA